MGTRQPVPSRGLGSEPRSLNPLSALLLSFLAACAGLTIAPEPLGEASPVFFPEPPERPRLQHLASYASEEDILPPVSDFQRFVLGEPDYAPIVKPYGVELHEGSLFICDLRRSEVVVFDLVHRSVRAIGSDRDGKLRKPVDIVVGEEGTRYVSDSELRRIMVYGPDDRYRTAFGDPERWKPAALAIRGDELYVTDMKRGEVVVLDTRRGRKLRTFGRFLFPSGLAFDPRGHAYVSDSGNAEVSRFDATGEFVGKVGSIGVGLGQFVRPKGLAVDREGRLYVVDAAFNHVQIFNAEGDLLMSFGAGEGGPGSLNLPAQIRIDYDNVALFEDRVAPGYDLDYLVIVTSQFGASKVDVYGFLTREGPKPPASGSGAPEPGPPGSP